ncbi:MAG: hypothetical protein IPJ98_26880 [Bryobacterales bacterium]|nr:hypothetical protein [Bryobacterales bacterium]
MATAASRAAVRIPLASGEALPIDWVIENYINKQIVDIVQPDISESGFTGGRRISYASWISRIRLIPTVGARPSASPRNALGRLLPRCLQRRQPAARALRTPPPHESPAWGLTTRPIQVDKADGKIAVPTAPGLGIEINLDELERHRVDLIQL